VVPCANGTLANGQASRDVKRNTRLSFFLPTSTVNTIIVAIMNNVRKSEIESIVVSLSELLYMVDNVRCREEDEYDNMSDEFQESLAGDKMSCGLDSLESAYDLIEEVISNLEEAIS
jgi:hypothetical protein